MQDEYERHTHLALRQLSKAKIGRTTPITFASVFLFLPSREAFAGWGTDMIGPFGMGLTGLRM